MRRFLPILLVTVLRAQGLPAELEIPAGLEVKPGSLQAAAFDRETFELPSPKGGPALRIPVEGRTWRLVLRSDEGRPLGALTLSERLRSGLDTAWTWEWRDRMVASRKAGERVFWLRASPGASGELKVLLVEKGLPRVLELPEPALRPEYPKGDEDFPYLPPWPGARLRVSAVSQAPVDAKFQDGTERIVLLNWIDKEYALPSPPTPHEFLVVYRAALQRAGWEIEGTLQGGTIQIQATYRQRGRDLRATFRLMEDAMGISVCDAGAQLKREAKPK